jgi:hypothetical protein
MNFLQQSKYEISSAQISTRWEVAEGSRKAEMIISRNEEAAALSYVSL